MRKDRGMILYITSYRNSEIIAEAVEKSHQTVMDSIINDRVSLSDFVKTKLSNLQSLSHIVIDLQALIDDEKEIIKTIQSLRMVYDDKRIILMDLSRKKGDELLSQLFSLGIYDIISGMDGDTEAIIDELMYCIETGRKFKDSMQYQKIEMDQKDAKEKVAEKVIVQNHIIKQLNNALIGIAGTSHRVGTSHHSIVVANYLKQQGHKVALLECSESPILNSYKEFFKQEGEEEEEGIFEYKNVTYYPKFPLEDIRMIFNHYNIIIIDFGTLKEEILNDFLRCMKRVIVTGSQPYELEYTDMILDLDENVLHDLNFVFQDANKELKKIIKENMDGENVYFTPLNIDPFKPESNKGLEELYSEFVNRIEKKEKKGWFHGLFSKR